MTIDYVDRKCPPLAQELDQFKQQFAATIRSLLSRLQSSDIETVAPFFRWRREDANHWIGEWENRRSAAIRPDSQPDWDALSEPIAEPFYAAFPKFREGCWGTRDFGYIRLQPSRVLSWAADLLVSRHPDLEVDDHNVESFADEIIASLETKSLHVRVYAPLANFTMDSDACEIPAPGVNLRKLTEDEIDELYGGATVAHPMQQRLAEFALCAETDAPITCSEDDTPEASNVEEIEHLFHDVVLALRTVKDGPTGHVSTYVTSDTRSPLNFCRVHRSISGLGEYIPSGKFELHGVELDRFTEHAGGLLRLLKNDADRSFRLACGRLSSASIRRDPLDSILDSAIGLEVILLHEVGNSKSRGKKGRRFARNYACLTRDPDARSRSFGKARDLYRLRSKIVHNGSPVEQITIGGKVMSLPEASSTGRSMLREVITHFLSDEIEMSNYRQEHYWRDRILNLSAG